MIRLFTDCGLLRQTPICYLEKLWLKVIRTVLGKCSMRRSSARCTRFLSLQRILLLFTQLKISVKLAAENMDAECDRAQTKTHVNGSF
ncbi:hypothetical protein RB195_014586 [Necator americanus]|uniref:Uncharacterized protein n=1 Tax=Necator americanus TaxID=51031 RepID=A0ABR1E166_NECAM